MQKLLKVVELFRFSAVVVAGDGNGHIGVGNGKASEVPDAIKKAYRRSLKEFNRSSCCWNYCTPRIFR